MDEPKKLSWFERRKDELKLAFAVFVFLISVIGCIEYYTKYYSGTFPSPFRLCVAIFNSTLSLFLANPTVNIGEPTPLTYEAARFLAPLLTSYCIYKLIQETILRYAGSLRHLFDRNNEIVVFGKNEQSMEFIDKLLEANKRINAANKRSIVLVASSPITDEERLNLEKKGVYIRKQDLYTSETEGSLQRAKRQNALAKLDFEKTQEIVFFEKDETINYALFGDFLSIARTMGEETMTHCSVYAENRTIRQAVSDLFDRYVEEEKKNNVSLVLFSIAELEVLNMLDKHRFDEPNLQVLKEKAEKGPVNIQDIPDVHILIAGLGSCGMMVLEKALQTGVLKNIENGRKNLTITVIDRDENTKKRVKTLYPMAEEICELHYINMNIEREGLEVQLDKLPQITYAAICFSNQTSDYLMLDRIRKFLAAEDVRHKDDPHWLHGLQVPVGIRMETNNSYLPFLKEDADKKCRIFDFGNVSEIYSVKNILRSALDEKAIQYNYQYQVLTARLRGEDPSSISAENEWHNLTYELRESNRAVVLNAPYFHELIHTIGADQYLREDDSFADWNMENDKKLKSIENTVVEDLARLEHQRWCGFYYSYGYVGACESKKDKRQYRFIEKDGVPLYGQVHNCLVDYSVLKESSDFQTIYYDLANVYKYASYKV